MKVVLDIEANSLVNPSHIWVIVCKCLEDNVTHIFRKVTENEEEKERFLAYSRGVDCWIGHSFLGYDYPVLNNLLGLSIPDIWTKCRDTLILSKLFNYSRKGGHSIEQYGKEFGLEKGKFSDWTKYSQEMEDYCVRDVEICQRIYLDMASKAMSESWRPAIELEHQFQLVVNSLHNNGFAFDSPSAKHLLEVVVQQIKELDVEIKKEFKPKPKLVKEIHPRRTQHGTLNRNDFRWVHSGDLSEYSGDPFSRISWVPFNPNSHKQLVAVLDAAGWKPVDRTATQQSWKVNENNLNTLPKTAPSPARTLARRILLESRRRTLTEWLGLVQADGRIHGKYYGIGAWTHRMAHQEPNTANIPTLDKLYGKEMRSLWQAGTASGNGKRLLVGVDAEGIQLRIFAHYINDKEFTDALVRGRKSDKTDPHSLNQRILGRICKSRQDAKRFIYAYLLGAGIQKLAEVLGARAPETQEALDRLLGRYTGLAFLKQNTIPKDARNGYFIGLDNRRVPIPGETPGDRKHLAMSGYLQNGEAIVIKKAACMLKDIFFCDIVHDEFVIECEEKDARRIGREACEAIRIAGEQLKLRCPLAGEYHVGPTWASIH